MIKAGTPREKVAAILKESGVKEGDYLVYRYKDEPISVYRARADISEGFTAVADYFYALRLTEDGPVKIELKEPREKTLEEKLEDALLRSTFSYLTRVEVVDICAKVAKEHYER